MLDWLAALLTADYMPHGYCFLWLPEVLWLHVVADGLTAASYYMIPGALLFFVRRRREVPFPWLFVLFSAFILACGTTHLFGIWTIWHATYGAEGILKLVTGLISFATALTLIPVIPKALALPSPAELARTNARLEQEIAERQRVEDELRVANGRLQDEVNERKLAEQRLRNLVHHDPLTGLPSRVLLHERLEEALARARREGDRLAVMLLDLDHFKHTNDTLGHPVGDRLLQILAARIKKVARAGDTIARLGGDEFAVIQNHLEDAAPAEALAARLLETVSQPCELAGEEVHVETSIGITLFPDDGGTSGQLISNADMALYQAKEQGGGAFRFFAPAMMDALHARKDVERELRRALQQDELALVYQPKIDLASRRIVGAEALLRWHHPERGLISPAGFVTVAEATGLIRQVGDKVLDEACRQAKAWAEEDLALRIAVNVSPGQFKQQDMYERVARALTEAGLPADLLELEITESLFLDNDAVAPCLAHITSLGVALSIDDFGTGYSSLSYLTRLPVERIKVDQSFVQQIGTSPEAEAIVRAVISLGHSLGKAVTAEGLETAEQFAFLRAHDCDEGQGFLISRPLAPADLRDLLVAQRDEGGTANRSA